MRKVPSDAHSIDTSYLLELQDFYERKFLNWIKLEVDLESSIASLQIKLALFKDKNDSRYLENREIVNTLAELKDSVSSFMFTHERLKYANKNLRMEVANLKSANQLLESELRTQKQFNNL